MSSDRSSLKLRAQEIIAASPGGITTQEALKKALAERYKNDPDGLLEYAAGASSNFLKDLRKRTYELPDPDLTLFNIPQVIGISTPDGDLILTRDSAVLGHVRQWGREGQQHHGTQKLRFKRFNEKLEHLKDEPDELPWWSARAIVAGPSESGDE